MRVLNSSKKFNSSSAPFPTLLLFVYELIWHCLIPIVLLRLIWRAKRNSAYLKNIPERFGFFGRSDAFQNAIWIHAVSVGETRAAQPLIHQFLGQGKKILLTHMTPTGRQTGLDLYAQSIASGQLKQVYLPYDICWAVESFLKRFKPHLGLFMETEAWPTFVFRCHQLTIPLFLINARLSQRSFKRVLRFGSAGRALFQAFAQILPQTELDAQRYRALGVDDCQVTGNLKFDVQSAPSILSLGQKWKQSLSAINRLMVCAASTRAGEEKMILLAWQDLLSDPVFQDTKQRPLLIIVPRHPDRFNEVANLIAEYPFSSARRSAWSEGSVDNPIKTAHDLENVELILGDSMGEMLAYYKAADVVIMGGSLLPTGGQNLIEACASGCPVILGEHTFNFQQASIDAIEAGAAIRIRADDHASLQITLTKTLKHLLIDTKVRQGMSEAALRFASSHQGAAERTMQILNQYSTN